MKKRTKIILGSVLSLIIVVCVVLLFIGNYFVGYTLKVDENNYVPSMGDSVPGEIFDTVAQREYDEYLKTATIGSLEIESFDGLTLYADTYNDQLDHSYYILSVHGYTSSRKNIAPAILPFVQQGFKVVNIDQRASGESDGDFITMGHNESTDILQWVDLIVEKDPNAQIILYGESMGAASVMLAGAKNESPNIVAIIEDCGYTAAIDMFSDQIKEVFNMSPFPFIQAADFVSTFGYGFTFSDAQPLKTINDIDVPVLFIHGSIDDYVPTYMVYELYEAFEGEKELLIIEGAKHADSTDVNPELYYSSVFEFIKKYVSY